MIRPWMLAIPLMAIAGCVKDPTTATPVIPLPSASGVYVVDEGNFGRNNAALSYYDLGSFQSYADVYAPVNGRPLGDVATGMIIRGEKGYVVINNSNRIEIIDLATNVDIGSIDTGPGSSPRRLAFVNDTIALETNLYEGTVGILDLKRLRVTGRTTVGSNPDGIAIAAGKAFVANSGFGTGTTVSVIDLGGFGSVSDPLGVVATLRVGDYPSGVRVTPSGQIYVTCTGSYGDYSNPNDDTPAKIFVIDPGAVSVVDSIWVGGHASDIALGEADAIGYVATTDSVVRIDTRSNRNMGLFLRGNYYCVGLEEVSGDVYVADPKNYVQPGTVTVYAATGQYRTSFDVGIIPGWFAFKRR